MTNGMKPGNNESQCSRECQEVRRFLLGEPVLFRARFSLSGRRLAGWGYLDNSSETGRWPYGGAVWETDTGKLLELYDPHMSPEMDFSAYNFVHQSEPFGHIQAHPFDEGYYDFQGSVRFPLSNSEWAVIDERKCAHRGENSGSRHYLFNCYLWQDCQTNEEDTLLSDTIKSIEFLPKNLSVLDISADGQRLLAAQPWRDGWGNVISVWDIAGQCCVATLQPEKNTANSGHLNTIKSARFLANRHHTVLTISYSSAWGAATGTDNVAGIIWDAITGIAKVPLFCWTGNRHWDIENIHDHALLNHGRWIALIRGDAEKDEPNDRIIKVLDTNTGEEIAVFEHPANKDGHGNHVDRIAADLDGTYLISTSTDETFARVWDVAANCQIARCDVGGTEVIDVDMKLIDGRVFFLTAHYQAMAVLWHLPNTGAVNGAQIIV
ncbi:WD40 repeat domain-containing protein [Marinobacter sp.]|uniref:WD40 repeat domain-containing protein n=1 Tax=Marinobacter sp. TaxID=50741 RepID=UPI003A944C81